MKTIIFALAISLLPFGALGAGGQNQHQTLNPVHNEEYNCVENLPSGVDLEDCNLLPSSPDADTVVYVCPPFTGDIVVVCTDDSSNDLNHAKAGVMAGQLQVGQAKKRLWRFLPVGKP